MIKKIDLKKSGWIDLAKKESDDVVIPGKKNTPPKKFKFPEIPGAVPPKSNVIPLGDTGFFITDNNQTSPTDCENYPDSLWCGGFPIDPFKVISLPWDLSNWSIVFDDCTLGIEFQPVVAWIKLPPKQFYFKSSAPECQPPPPPPKPPSPGEVSFGVPDTKVGCLYDIEVLFSSTVIRGDYSYTEDDGESYTIGGNVYAEENSIVAYHRVWGPITGISVALTGGTLTRQYVVFLSSRGIQDFFPGGHFDACNTKTLKQPIQTAHYSEFTLEGGGSLTSSITELSFIKCQKVRCFICPIITPPPPLPLTPLPPQDMNCCGLVAELLEKIIKIENALGVDEYPASLPASIISKDEGWLGNLIPNANVEINNLTQLVGWHFERVDELFGQWEIPIEVKDADPTTPGDQPAGFKLPNLAEAVAEIFGLLLQISINSETIVNIATRSMIDSGQDKQQNFRSYKLLDALCDYVGFGYDEKKVKFPMQFTPGKEQLDQLLQESEIDVPVVEYSEKGNLQQNFIRWNEMAGMIKAAFYKKTTTGSTAAEIKTEIMNDLKRMRDLAKKVNDDVDADLDKYMSDAEVGFTNQPNVGDPNLPYGEPFDRRPEIKKLN